MKKPFRLPAVFREDLLAWAKTDLPKAKYRDHPEYLYRAANPLRWIAANFSVKDWRDLRPSMFQAFFKARPEISMQTHADYLKSVRRFLRWAERDDFAAPVISARLKGLIRVPAKADPFSLPTLTYQQLLQRALFVFAGSTHLHWTRTDGKRRRASMLDWPRGAFRLWLRFGVEVGLRPWEIGWLRWDEVVLDADLPHVQLADHPRRQRKTPMAGTRLYVGTGIEGEIRALRNVVESKPFVFAVRGRRGDWRPPFYDQIWRALREEFDLPRLNGYALRRTFATQLTARTANLFDVVRATRHKNPMTLKHYVTLDRGIVDPRTGQVLG